MFKFMARQLKPFLGILVLALVFLGLQATTDLSLPEYLSKIVNVGIQQGGIEYALPEVVEEDLMAQRLGYLEESERQTVLDLYTKVSADQLDYDPIIKEYPNLKADTVYVLQDVEKEELETASDLMAKGIIEDTKSKNPQLESMLSQSGNPAQDKIMAIAMVKKDYERLGFDVGSLQQDYILKSGLIMMIITLIGAAAAISLGMVASRVSAGVGRNMRKEVFHKVSTYSNTEFDEFSTASLITRTTNDVNKVQQLTFMLIRMAAYAPIIGIGGIIKALQKVQSMTWIIALALILIAIVIFLVFSYALPRFKAIQKMVDQVNRLLREHLMGLLVVRAFTNEEFHEKRFDKANKDLTKMNLSVSRVMISMMPFMTFIMNAVMVLIVWVGAHDIANGMMQVGDMMAFMQYAMQIIMAFLMLSMMFIMLPRAAVSVERIKEVVNMEPTIVDAEKPLDGKVLKKEQRGVLEFNHVHFKYPGAEEDMLKDIDFTAKPGEVTAIIGATGSGKTTLLNLIPRFYDVSSGSITLAGKDIRQLKQSDLREEIAYVPQKSLLFRGTIESNLKYGNEEADEDTVAHFASIAQATEFINSKPEGMEEAITTGGNNVSGGQKQRLSIARALLKDASIYVFDDSFSALDFATDAKLRAELRKEMSDATLLIVAQRVSTIKDANQILVLDDGKVVGHGTHKELMADCEVYREIATSQLSEEELV